MGEHWAAGTWQVSSGDAERGWIPGSATVTLPAHDGTGPLDLTGKVSLRYEHPALKTIIAEPTRALLVGNTLTLDLSPIAFVTAPPSPNGGGSSLVLGDAQKISLRIGDDAVELPVEVVPAPPTRIAITWDPALQIADGIWTQPNDRGGPSTHPTARRGETDDIGQVQYGREVWTRQVAFIAGVQVDPPPEPGAHANPVDWPRAQRRRTLMIAGRSLPAQPVLSIAAPFTASGWRLVEGADARAMAERLRLAHDPALRFARVEISWPESATPAARMHALAIDDLRVDWMLAFVPWPIGIGVARNDAGAGEPMFVLTERVWPGDEIVVRLLPPQGVSRSNAVRVRMRSVGSAGQPLDERVVEIPPGGDESAPMRAGPGGIAVEEDGEIVVSFEGASAALPTARAAVWKVPSGGQTTWQRALSRAAAVWTVPSTDPKHPVTSIGGVPVQLQDHAALLHLRDVLSHVMHQQIRGIERESTDAWAARLRAMVSEQTLPDGTKVRAPLADVEIRGPDDVETTVAILAKDVLVAAADLGVDGLTVARWWPDGLAQARAHLLESMRAAHTKVKDVGDDDMDGLHSIAAMAAENSAGAGGDVARMAASRLHRWDAGEARLVADMTARSVVVSIGTISAHADADAELTGVYLSIAGAAIGVLTGGVAYVALASALAAAPAIAAGAVVIGFVADVALLLPEFEKWSQEDWRVEVASGGYLVTGNAAYAQAAEAQTGTFMRVFSCVTVLLGPVADGFDIAAKVAKVNLAAAKQIATRVLNAGKLDEAIAGLSAGDRAGLARYLEDAARRANELPLDKLDDLERRALDMLDQIAAIDPRVAVKPAVRAALAELPAAGGHALKLAGTGACSICSFCTPLGELYQGILEMPKYADLAKRLGDLETALKKAGTRILRRPDDDALLDAAADIYTKLRRAADDEWGEIAGTLTELRGVMRGGDDVAAFEALRGADKALTKSIADVAARGNVDLALSLVRTLGRTASPGGKALIDTLTPTARAGLRKLLAGKDELPLIGAYLCRYRRSRFWRGARPEAVTALLERVSALNDIQMEGLRTLFVAGGSNVLVRGRAREFSSALLDATDHLFEAPTAFADMLEVVARLRRQSVDGLPGLVSALSGRSANAFYGALFQLDIAARALEEFAGTSARVVLEVGVDDIRRIDIRIVDDTGKILLEIETKGHNAFKTLNKLATLRQWVKDLERVADRGEDSLATIRWVVMKEIEQGGDMAPILKEFFGCVFDRKAFSQLRGVPGLMDHFNEIEAMLKRIGDDRLTKMGADFHARFEEIVPLM